MASSKPKPKVLLFDIGGVCVISPFRAILDYELSHSIPPGWINHSISILAPTGFFHRLERGEIAMNAEFFKGFTADLHNTTLWPKFYLNIARARDPNLPESVPPLPKIDGEEVFWSMMSAAREPDPWMYPALVNLKKSGEFILAALSNTVIFPEGHEFNVDLDDGVRSIFDIFISSAHVGLRKPSPEIYSYALRTLNDFAKSHPERGFSEGIKAEDILFLDDIGENLKAGKKAGFGTLKVNLGRAFEAVDELERVTGLKLAGGWERRELGGLKGGKELGKARL